MVYQPESPVKRRRLVHTPDGEELELGFQHTFDSLLLSHLGNLPYDTTYDYTDTKYPDLMPFITARAIQQQFLTEGVPRNKIPDINTLIELINDAL